MPTPVQRPDVADLLRTEHAVARVLASAAGEHEAYPQLLAAIGGALDWDVGAVWEPTADGRTLRSRHVWETARARCGDFLDATRTLELAEGEGLPGRVWGDARPAWITDVEADGRLPRSAAAAAAGLRSAFAFPVGGAGGPIGVIEFFTTERRAGDDDLLATMTSLGLQIGQFVERCRAQQAVRESDARKSAILNAAFDCVVTMDHHGNVVEVNRATERTFGYTSAEMVGRELAVLIVPESLREAHRRGLERYLATGEGRVINHPIELDAMRADGSEFPVELAITRPDLPGPPLFCGYLRDVTERHEAEKALRRLADEQAALRRVATVVAAEPDPSDVFALVTEEVGHLLDAQTSNMIRFEQDGTASVVGAWSDTGARAVPVGERVALDGDTAGALVWRTGAPARVDSYEGLTGSLAETLRGLGFKCAVGAPVMLGGTLWGAVMVSSARPEPFPAGSEQRIGDFAELAAQALANAQAREELAASRARIVEAGDAERRRLERNLHDGAQQRLVSLAVDLGVATRRLDDPDARATLARAGEDLAQALEELRELARGIHPAILSDRGLEPAVRALADRCTLPVKLSIDLDERLPEPVEAAAYYVVAEALTNAAKYAHAGMARVAISRNGRDARIVVTDDGVGGADRGRGTGLRGLADRIEALGGQLAIDSPAGAGTTLTAVIPAR